MKKILLPIAILITVLTGGCKKYLDVNQNPNAAEQPPISGLLANTTYKTGNNVFYISDYTSYYVQYLASPNPASPLDIYDNVNASSAWDSIYTIMSDLYDMRKIGMQQGFNAYVGVADV